MSGSLFATLTDLATQGLGATLGKEQVSDLVDDVIAILKNRDRLLEKLAEALELAKLARRTVRDRLGDMHNARVASCLEQACRCPYHHAGEV